jgi:hypothetical protein
MIDDFSSRQHQIHLSPGNIHFRYLNRDSVPHLKAPVCAFAH